MPGKPTILVADDNPDDAFFLALAFKKVGSAVTLHFVQDGRQAIDYLQGLGPYGDRVRFPFPDLFVTELRLPGMSALELLDRLRQHRSFHRLVIGLLSDVDYEPDIRKALALGARFFFAKRINFRDLVETARQLSEKCANLNPRETSGHASLPTVAAQAARTEPVRHFSFS
jgi:CheY-like chemotaxis protein